MRFCHPFRNGIPLFRAGHQRVTHPFATNVLLHPFDLHVLGTPPAFILSQDQTLRCIFPYALSVRLFYTIVLFRNLSGLFLFCCFSIVKVLSPPLLVSGGKDWLYSLSRFRQVPLFVIYDIFMRFVSPVCFLLLLTLPCPKGRPLFYTIPPLPVNLYFFIKLRHL